MVPGLLRGNYRGTLPSSSHHSQDTHYQSDLALRRLTLIAWPRLCGLTFLTGVTLSLLPIRMFWKAVTLSKPHLWSEELSSPIMESRIFAYIIVNSSEQGICLFFIYSIVYFYQYRLMDVYFYTLGHNPLVLYLLLLKLFSFGLWELSSSVPMAADTPASAWGSCGGLVWSTSLPWGTTKCSGSSCRFPSPVLESDSSPTSKGDVLLQVFDISLNCP